MHILRAVQLQFILPTPGAAFSLPQVKMSPLAGSQHEMMQILILLGLRSESSREARIHNGRHTAARRRTRVSCLIRRSYCHGNMLFIHFLLFVCLGNFSLLVGEKRYRRKTGATSV